MLGKRRRNRPAFSNQPNGEVCCVASGTCFLEQSLLPLTWLEIDVSPFPRNTHFGYAPDHQETDGLPSVVAKTLNVFCYPDSLSLDHQATMQIIGERCCDLDETRARIPGAG